jgi:hypothetical protein
MGRNVKDAKFIAVKALPAAAASNNTDAFDLGTRSGFLPEELECQVVIPALPSLTDAKSATFTIKDSANGTDFTAITGFGVITLTGAGGAGAAAKTVTLRLPSTTRRYLRLDAAVESGGGTNTGVSVTFQLLF